MASNTQKESDSGYNLSAAAVAGFAFAGLLLVGASVAVGLPSPAA